jgi:hypothetical protein
MGPKTCWPEWLTRRNVQRFGPDFQGDIPYPIYQVQPAVLSADNPNTNAQVINDSFYQSAVGQILVSASPTTIVHIMPNNTYDTISIMAFTSPAFAAGPPTIPDIGVPIYFSFDRPGRIVTEQPQQGSPEFQIATANAFDPGDPSGFPTCIVMPQVMLNRALTAPAAIYSSFQFPSVKTNRPFYFWFNDGIATPPQTATAINFKASWYVQGR